MRIVTHHVEESADPVALSVGNRCWVLQLPFDVHKPPEFREITKQSHMVLSPVPLDTVGIIQLGIYVYSCYSHLCQQHKSEVVINLVIWKATKEESGNGEKFAVYFEERPSDHTIDPATRPG